MIDLVPRVSFHLERVSTSLIHHLSEAGSIDLSVKRGHDPVNLLVGRAGEKMSAEEGEAGVNWVFSSTLEASANMYFCAAGAVGGGASGEGSDGQTVLCGSGLWKRAPGSHPDQ